MSDIFVSYAREDLGIATSLVSALRAQGWSVWWDSLLPPGKTFDKSIEYALSEARCVIVLWSNSSVDSDWVRSEASEGLRRGILIPLMLDNAAPPFGFRLIHSIGFNGWTGQTSASSFQDLRKAIGQLIGHRIAPRLTKGSPEVTPLQFLIATVLLVLFIAVVVSINLDQGAGSTEDSRITAAQPVRTDWPIEAGGTTEDVETQDNQPLLEGLRSQDLGSKAVPSSEREHSLNAEQTAASTSEPEAQDPCQENGVARVDGFRVMLKPTPDFLSEKIAYLEHGVEIKTLGAYKGGFCEVEVNGIRGWVRAIMIISRDE